MNDAERAFYEWYHEYQKSAGSTLRENLPVHWLIPIFMAGWEACVKTVSLPAVPDDPGEMKP